MSTDDALDATTDEGAAPEAPKRKLNLDVQISDVGPCKKHLKVSIPHEEVERQFDESLGTVRREAQVPGFRPGRAPRTLVERRFRKEVSGQVKGALLMACMEQLDEDYKLNPIAQPQLDLEAIDLPEDGPMKFELDIEVEPDFPLPAYKALAVKRPVRQVGDADVEAYTRRYLERYAQQVPKAEGEGAELGDFVTANLIFRDRAGNPLNEAKETTFRLQHELRFQDGSVPDLAGILVGAKSGESRQGTADVGSASANPALRGQQIGVTFEVLDLKRLRLPEVTPGFLQSIGFESEEELREEVRAALGRRLAFQQREEIKRQIIDALLAESPFDLPADLVARQERSTLRRRVEEMRQGGLGDAEIRAREAEIRANAHEQTLRSLKEYFLLSKIAEAEGLAVGDEDFEEEVLAMAERSEESPRRVRARIEKEGLREALAGQILERKTIDRVLEYVKFEEVAMTDQERDVETLDQTATPAAEEADGAEAPVEADAPAAEAAAPRAEG